MDHAFGCSIVCCCYFKTFNFVLGSRSLSGKESASSVGDARDVGSIPGSGKSPGERNCNPLQYSCLENPTDRGMWQATVHGVSKSRTRLSDFTFTFGAAWSGTSVPTLFLSSTTTGLFRFKSRTLDTNQTGNWKITQPGPFHPPVIPVCEIIPPWGFFLFSTVFLRA